MRAASGLSTDEEMDEWVRPLRGKNATFIFGVHDKPFSCFYELEVRPKAFWEIFIVVE